MVPYSFLRWEPTRKASLVFALALAMSAAAIGDMPQGDPFQSAQPGPHTKEVNLQDYQHVLYVTSNGVGDGRRQQPLGRVKAALEKTTDASPTNRYAILVATGTYDTVNLQLNPYVDLFGGYNAKDWTRDIIANETFLDAGGMGRVLIESADTRVDGFTITGGRVRGHGGAILCGDTTPALTNNVFKDNGTLIPEGYRLDRQHWPASNGGAIACLFEGVPTIANNLFVGNTTEIGDGAAIYCYEDGHHADHPYITIANNVFIDNRAGIYREDSMSRSSNGGAIACSHNASPIIVGNVILHNQANDNSDAGGIYCEYGAKPVVRGNRIVANRSWDDGGGMYVMQTSEPSIEGNLFVGGWSHRGGVGGLRLSKEGRARATNNIFAYNINGGIDCVGSRIKLINNSFVSNTGCDLMLDSPPEYFRPSVARNNIFWDNPAAAVTIRPGPGVPPIVENNLTSDTLDGPGNISTDPKFVADGLSGRIASAVYRPGENCTILQVSTPSLENLNLAGRVIRVGEVWSVIKSTDERCLMTVWDDMHRAPDPTVRLQKVSGKNRPDTFKILPTYRLRPDSPSIGKGMVATR